MEHFRGLTRVLTHNNVPYHTYALPIERNIRVVLRGEPYELSNEGILEHLESQGLPVEAVHMMYSQTGEKILFSFCSTVKRT